jgi:site-specific DNA-methyltransferase (adenine-specific)
MTVSEYPKIELLNVDCMEYMATVPDKYFDLAVVDPPYGIGRDGKPKSTSSHGGHKGYEFKGWDNEIPSAEYFTELFRVSKNQIIFGANYFAKYLPASSGWILWDKGQRIDQADGELAFTSIAKPLRVFTLNRVAIQTDGAIHPTQKPVKLYRWLLHNYAKEGDKILDTHGGSMSSAIACHQMGFDLTLCELDKDYYEAGVKRFKEQTMQQDLFKQVI